jgi:MFS family permease
MKRIARLPHFAGVILACGCLIGVLGFGPRSGMGFLLTPMSSAHSWGRDVFALALAIQMLLWGAAQPFAGAMADRFGARQCSAWARFSTRLASPRWPMPERRRCSTSVPAL